MRDWKVVRFEPLDVLINADPRGLEDGGFGHAGEISPIAFAGTLRTAILRSAGHPLGKGKPDPDSRAQDAAKIVGYDGGDFPFRFSGPLLFDANKVALYFPVPLLFTQTSPSMPLVASLAPLTQKDWLADSGLKELSILSPDPGARNVKIAEGWIRTATLARLLSEPAATLPECATEWGKLEIALRKTQEPKDFFESERRHGHKRGKTGVVEEGKLFSRAAQRFRQEADHTGLKSCAYAGLLDGVPQSLLPEANSVVRLAGDGHLSILLIEENESLLSPLKLTKEIVKKALPTLRGLWLYLGTQAIFRDGWLPDFGRTLGLKLVAAAVGRPRAVGGWDAKEGRPKPVYRAVPAGSVYLYAAPKSISEQDLCSLIEHTHGNGSVSHIYPELGFGLGFLGVWNARPYLNEKNAGGNP